MLGFRQKQLLCLACFLLALCGAGDLWAPGPGDDEGSAAPTLKRKRSDDDVASSASKEQPESKKRRPNQKKSAGTPCYLGKPVMSRVLALPEEQIYADGQLDTGFKKLLQDKAILMKFLELFVPECKVGVEDIETIPPRNDICGCVAIKSVTSVSRTGSVFWLWVGRTFCARPRGHRVLKDPVFSADRAPRACKATTLWPTHDAPHRPDPTGRCP